jgi:hypothetical protein
MDLSVLLEPKIDLERLSEVLDGFGHEGRVHTTRTWDKKKMSAIYEACDGFKPLTLDDLVPPSIGPLVEVICDLKNSLPAFSVSQKRFCRPTDPAAHPDKLWGYNETNHFQESVHGPGYFVAKTSEKAGEVNVDYKELPPEKPASWPKIVDNTGVGGLVYGNMVDRMRKISNHVFIGRAERNGTRGSSSFASTSAEVV